MLAILFALATFASTLAGGLVALKNRDKLHLILGFTAGILLGVVAFELLPEIFKLTGNTTNEVSAATVALVVGFLGFHALEKLTVMHTAHEGEYGSHKHPAVGVISASMLILHSLFDGIGIGIAFKVSNSVGILVALAVIAHDFSDGLNTVTLMLLHRNSNKRSVIFLIGDALAPVVGVLIALTLSPSPNALLLYLSFFAGFLLYLGASDILPEAHSTHPSRVTLLLTILGTALIFVVSRFST